MTLTAAKQLAATLAARFALGLRLHGADLNRSAAKTLILERVAAHIAPMPAVASLSALLVRFDLCDAATAATAAATAYGEAEARDLVARALVSSSVDWDNILDGFKPVAKSRRLPYDAGRRSAVHGGDLARAAAAENAKVSRAWTTATAPHR